MLISDEHVRWCDTIYGHDKALFRLDTHLVAGSSDASWSAGSKLPVKNVVRVRYAS
jgi:hypothetical protein